MNGKANVACDEITFVASVLDGVLTQTDRPLHPVTALEPLQFGATAGT